MNDIELNKKVVEQYLTLLQKDTETLEERKKGRSKEETIQVINRMRCYLVCISARIGKLPVGLEETVKTLGILGEVNEKLEKFIDEMR